MIGPISLPGPDWLAPICTFIIVAQEYNLSGSFYIHLSPHFRPLIASIESTLILSFFHYFIRIKATKRKIGKEGSVTGACTLCSKTLRQQLTGDEGSYTMSKGKMLFLWNYEKLQTAWRVITKFDNWADTRLHLLLLKSSMVEWFF